MNKTTVITIVISFLLLLFGWQRYAIQSLKHDLVISNQHINQLRKNRDDLARNLTASEADKASLIEELQHRDLVLASRDSALATSRKELAELSEKLRGLRKTDEEYNTWSQAHVPDSVIWLLRSTRKANNSQNRTPESSSAKKSD